MAEEPLRIATDERLGAYHSGPATPSARAVVVAALS